MIKNCPECGAPGVPVIYGRPDPALSRAAADGRLALGGRLVAEDGDEPNWVCPASHGGRDDDLSGRERLGDEIVARYDNRAPDGVDRVSIRGGASTIGWSDDRRALTIVTPGVPDEVALFSPDSRWLVMFMDGGYRVRGTDDHFEDLYDKRSNARRA